MNPTVAEYVRHADQAKFASPRPNSVNYTPPDTPGTDWPPGVLGAVAGFVYDSAPRQIPEVAIATALGLMAGITGRSYNIDDLGLNLYIILVAKSAVGKGTVHSGIGHILRSSCGQSVSRFVDFADYESAKALLASVEKRRSFVNVVEEWGRTLQEMSSDKRGSATHQLRTAMTRLYQRSSASSVAVQGSCLGEHGVGGAAAYSLIGETNPGTFYSALTESMMEDGFLSRFNVIEYTGDRPPSNPHPSRLVPRDLADVLKKIANHSESIMAGNGGLAVNVKADKTARSMLNDFDAMCDKRIHEAGDEEGYRQIWNRAHLKSLRISAILAVCDDHIAPMISSAHAEWAINLIRSECHNMVRKISGGDVGCDENTRYRKLRSLFHDYVAGRISQGYNPDPRMVNDKVVPRTYLQIRTGQIKSFKNYRLGSTRAMDDALRDAIDRGDVLEITKSKSKELYGYNGSCFQFLDEEK